MSTDKGYVKVYRDIRDHWIWCDEPFDKAHAWIDLLMLVNHKDKKILFNGKMMTVQRGARITSIKTLAARWQWSRHKVSDFLDELEKDGMIKQNRDTRRTLIFIENYGLYQGSEKSVGTSKGHLKDISRTSQGHKQETIEEAIEETIEEIRPSIQDEPGEPWGDEGWQL